MPIHVTCSTWNINPEKMNSARIMSKKTEIVPKNHLCICPAVDKRDVFYGVLWFLARGVLWAKYAALETLFFCELLTDTEIVENFI